MLILPQVMCNFGRNAYKNYNAMSNDPLLFKWWLRDFKNFNMTLATRSYAIFTIVNLCVKFCANAGLQCWYTAMSSN